MMMKRANGLIPIIMASLLMVMAWSPVAAQEASTTGTVQVMDNGHLDVYVCPFSNNKTDFVVDFWGSKQQPSVTSQSGADTVGRLVLCYVDTKSDREAFSVAMSATEFHSITPGVNATIPATNLSMERTQSISRNNVGSGHADAPGIGMMYSTNGSTRVPARASGTTDHALKFGAAAVLTSPQIVAIAEAGRGISVGVEDPSGQHTYTARQTTFMRLHVPAGTPAATYQTTITITLTSGTP